MTPHFDHLDPRLPVLANNGVTQSNCYIASHFSHLDPSNAMMTLTTLLVSFDTNPSVSGVIEQKSCCTSFQFVVDLRKPVVSHDQKFMAHLISVILT